MEVWRSGEALLRQSHSLLPLLGHPISRTSAVKCPRHVARPCLLQPRHARHFTSSASRRESSLDPSRLTTEDNDSIPVKSSFGSPLTARDLSSVLSALQDSPRKPTSSTSTKGGALNAQLDALLESMGRPRGANDSKSSKETSISADALDWLTPRDPDRPIERAPIVEKDLPWKLNASAGRRIRLEPDRGFDLARSLRQLDIVCNTNRIKRDAQRQKFHERPGLKRKRLKSERWRRQFKEGFRAVVQKAKAMKKQGW